MINCVPIDETIKELSKETGYSPQEVSELTGIWREKDPDNRINSYPGKGILKDLYVSLETRPVQTVSVQTEIRDTYPVTDYMQKVDRVYNAQTKRARVQLLSQLFSMEVTRRMEETARNLRNQIENENSPSRKYVLSQQLALLDRRDIIASNGPSDIFMSVRDSFDVYVQSSEDECIALERDNLESLGMNDPKRLDEESRNIAIYKRAEFNKILSNYRALSEEASIRLLLSEGIRISLETGRLESGDMDTVDENGESVTEAGSDEMTREEAQKEGWMTKYTMVSSEQSLSKEIRKLINTLPRLDREGYQEEDDLGFPIYLDSNYVHATLIEGLRYMSSPGEMMPLLERMSSKNSWISSIIELLENDESLKAKFYRAYNKDFIPYFIQRNSTDTNGRISNETISINTPGGIYAFMNTVRENIQTGNVLSKDSIYTRKGTLDTDAASRIYNSLRELTRNYDKAENKESFANEGNARTLDDILKALGIAAETENSQAILSDEREFKQLREGVYGIINRIMKLDNGDHGSQVLVDNFKSAYMKIAGIYSRFMENAIESSSSESGKTYYGHVQPSYVGRLLNRLKNVLGDKKAYDDFIETEYGQYSWFRKGDRWLNKWLEWLTTDDSIREGMRHKVLLNADKVNYSDMSSPEYAMALINEYRGDPGDWAYYHVPIMSNAPIARFIRMPKRTNLNEIVDDFVNVVEQEFDRILLVNDRVDLIREGKVNPIDNFDIKFDKNGNVSNIGGGEFKFLPRLNDLRYEGKTFAQRLMELSSDNRTQPGQFEIFVKEEVSRILEQGSDDMLEQFRSLGLLETVEIGNTREYKYFPGYHTEEEVRGFLREYYYNSAFSTSQIIQLTTTDLAFYKNAEDFQKRFKEINSPADRLYTHAKFQGETIGRPYERTIYLNDKHMVSTAIAEIEEVLRQKVKDGTITKPDMDTIMSKYKDINVTDAQAYRSLSSYRSILGMTGEWTDRMQQAYDNFSNGTWNMEDFWTLWQPIKPFVYSQTPVNSGFGGRLKMPVQHKNSEFLLMTIYDMVAGPTGKSQTLKALNRFMEDHGIDVIQFESAVKVGGQGKIDLEGLNTYDEVYDKLMKDTGISEGIENTDVIHVIDYNDYGIQQSTPEHFLDATGLEGTQLRKLVPADIPVDSRIIVNGKEVSFQDWMNEYNAMHVENILQSFMSTREVFNDPRSLSNIIQEETRSGSNYSSELVKAGKLDGNNEFILPIYDEIQSNRVQPLLTSIIKSRITKQKIKGGSAVQVSNFGLTDDLNIVFEGEGENRHIKYLECYLPWYSREYIQDLMKEGTNTLDIDKIPDELRRIIGYRIPTENKYSMLPLYIKGFLPRQSGGAIMLPSDITTITGSDFDIDKMYLMIPEFRVTDTIDYRAMKKRLMAQYKGKDRREMSDRLDIVMDEIANGKIAFSEGSFEMGVYDWVQQHKESYKSRKIRKVQYDDSLSPKENGTAARNNRIIDLIWGALTHPSVTLKTLNPQGFDELRRSARISDLLRSGISMTELQKAVGEDLYSGLKELTIKQLDKLLEKYKRPVDPLNPSTQVYFHKNNMTGSSMIGIYANHNANHAMMQFTDLSLSPKHGAFSLFGRRELSLNRVSTGERDISDIISQYLAASVDNVKDPVLESMNQNSFTADASMLLARLGYSGFEVGLLMNQPVVREMTDLYTVESRKGTGRTDIANMVAEKWARIAGISTDYEKTGRTDFSHDVFIRSLLSEDRNDKKFIDDQARIAVLFERIVNTADALAQLVRASRSDTAYGAAGPFISDVVSKIDNIEDFSTKARQEYFPLTGADILDTGIVYDGSEEGLRERIMNSRLPILQAFYSLGLKESANMLGRWFPHFKNDFRAMTSRFADMTKTGRLNRKTLKSIYSDAFTYTFGKSEVCDASKRADYLNRFPDDFLKVVSSNEDIASLDFIRKLQITYPSDGSNVRILSFSTGRLSTSARENLTRDWASLLYMDNPEANRLALDLVAYSYFRGGFSFMQGSFVHLAPVVVLQSIPGYVETERSMMTTEEDYSDFTDQYMRNHLANKSLVPQSVEGNVKFTENGKFVESVVISPGQKLTQEDRKMVKGYNMAGGRSIPVYMDYIAKESSAGELAFYRKSMEGNNTVYTRIEPLGIPSVLLEYDYNTQSIGMTSVVSGEKDMRLPESMETETMDDMEYDNRLNDFDAEAYSTRTLENSMDEGPSIGNYNPIDFVDDNNKPIC